MSIRVPISRPHLWGDEISELERTIKAGWLSWRSPVVEEFESAFASRVGAAHAISVSSGTVALFLALEGLGIGPGDEVILPGFGMASPLFAVLYVRATPVFVDVDETWNLDPCKLDQSMTDRTKAIIVIHTYGHPAKMEEINAIATARRAFVIEDAAEALGAMIGARPVGSFGDVACFSLYSNKTITTGDGGMLVTNNKELADLFRRKRNLCFGTDPNTHFIHREIAYRYPMSGLQAAVGLAQLCHFDAAVRGRRQVAAVYEKRLISMDGVQLRTEAPWAKEVPFMYPILLDEALGLEPASVAAVLLDAGIETRLFFPPLDTQPLLPSAHLESRCPLSETLYRRGLCLPLYPDLEYADIDTIVNCLESAIGEPQTVRTKNV